MSGNTEEDHHNRVTPGFFYGYRIVLAGFFTASLGCGLSFYGFSVLNKPVGDEFGWSRGTVTAAFFAFLVAAAIVSPIVGRISDRRGPRQVLFLGTVAMAAALILLSRTSAIWHFYLLYCGIGIGYAFMGPVPLSIIISNWFHRLRGTMQGLTFTGIGFGGLVLAPTLGNYLVPNIGWRSTYLVMAFLLIVIMVPLLAFVVKDHPRQKGLRPYGVETGGAQDEEGSITQDATGLSLSQALGTLAFWIFALTSAVYGMGMTAPLMNQVSILGEQGFTSLEAVSAIGLLGLFSAVGKFLFGFLCDRINPRYAAAISYALVASCLVVMLQASTSVHLWLYAILMGLGQGGWAPNIAMLTAYYFGRKHYGAVLGAVNLIFIAGEAVAPMIAGFAFDRTGSYRMILTLFALLCFISVPLIALIKKPKIT